MVEHAQIAIGTEIVGGEITSQFSNGEWHIQLDSGDGRVIHVSHIDRRAGILKALCRACGFDAWLIQSAATSDVTSSELLT
ncbi:hypothetical protein [Schlesneria paludicola]|uniref:hypothetical protein n=1 Tax=Schlesneria paludicola TaxID=360056 RepID=UPI00029A1863|nr:hypothetical protein [Schlesneria paludicola]